MSESQKAAVISVGEETLARRDLSKFERKVLTDAVAEVSKPQPNVLRFRRLIKRLG